MGRPKPFFDCGVQGCCITSDNGQRPKGPREGSIRQGWKDRVTKKTRLTKDRFQLWRQALLLKRQPLDDEEEGA